MKTSHYLLINTFRFALFILIAQSTYSLNEINTLFVNRDAHVRGGIYSNENYGTSKEIEIKAGASNNFLRDAYLQFDLDDFSSINSARLLVYGYAQTTMNLGAYQTTTTTWREKSITWDNRPPFVAGQLSQLREVNETFNENILTLPTLVSNTAVATTEDLNTPDLTHFDSEGQRILGTRYADAFLGLINVTNNKENNSVVEEISEITIYPNPVSAITTTLNAAGSILTINDINGSKIFTIQISNNNQIIDLNHLNKGVYYAKISKKGNSKIIKIIK